MEFLKSGVFWTIVGIIFATIIGITGILVAVHAIPRKTLRYSLFSQPLIEAEMSGLKRHTIIVDGQPAKSVIKTTVHFINTGNRQIEPSDFSDTMPLRITAKNKLFYPADGYQIHAKDPKSIKLDVIDEKTLDVNCAYIKPRRPFSIDVLHDGNLSVSGELKSGTIVFDSNSSAVHLLLTIPIVFSILTSLFLISLLCYKVFFSPESPPFDLAFAVFSIFALFISLFMFGMSTFSLGVLLQALGVLETEKSRLKRQSADQ